MCPLLTKYSTYIIFMSHYNNLMMKTFFIAHTGKEEVKLISLADNMIISVENLMDSTTKLLSLAKLSNIRSIY